MAEHPEIRPPHRWPPEREAQPDTLPDKGLAQRQQRSGQQVMRVVLSGEDLATLPATLDCLTALHRNGYLLVLVFSHSAMQSLLHTACLDALAQRGINVVCDNLPPQASEAFHSLFLPALSTNSASKIALGIRDNLVCHWAFHALSSNKPVIVTLNPECRTDANTALPSTFRARLMNYTRTLAGYGFTIIGQPVTHAAPQPSGTRRLVTLSDVRQYPNGHELHIGTRTLITPAARDEIRDRGIVIVQDPPEDTCIWQE